MKHGTESSIKFWRCERFIKELGLHNQNILETILDINYFVEECAFHNWISDICLDIYRSRNREAQNTIDYSFKGYVLVVLDNSSDDSRFIRKTLSSF
jgi:hypothetical protein